ncbi:hypothetical protein SOVF_113580 [Spinacia oleracea]|uniref:Pectinesterase inhibitor-like n=1 Tax=Spinacia oleracea TaxID=3562 RepID=A0A9R0JHT9_SPIOL|nr:pectinesterase inhibitor-like [Spinacia oleracea]KNA13788.1 hypothetical protein SOVF_113580 [Spinacia oleracea]
MSSKSVKLAFLCIIFSIQSLTLIKADEALITKLCSSTSSPKVCTNCLESDPSSKTANDVGLVDISMICATKDMDILYQDSFRYQGNTTDPATKEALNQCLDQFEDAKTKVNQISDTVHSRDFNLAQQLSNKVSQQVMSCNQFFQAKGVPMPDVVANDLSTVSGDWIIVMDILGSLKS